MSADTRDIRTDIRILRPLNVIGGWIGVLPTNNRCLYPSALVVFILIIYGYETYGKLTKISDLMEMTVHFIDLASDASITITNISAIVWINIINGHETESFFSFWKVIDMEFRFTLNKKHGNLYFYLELIAAHVLFLFYAIFDGSLWMNTLGLQVYRYYIFKPLQIYHIIILAMLLRHYASSIRFRFETLNDILCEFQIWDEKQSAMSSKVKMVDRWDLKRIIKVYTKITVALDKYNSTFGSSFVALYIWIILNLLMPIDIALVYGGGKNEVLGNSFGTSLVMLCLVWTSIPLVITAAIFAPCHKATAEAEKTTYICYTLLNDLSNSEADKYHKKQLEELAQQSTNKNLRFSAAGFFTLNYNVIYCMFGSISSYLIVLIQLHK